MSRISAVTTVQLNLKQQQSEFDSQGRRPARLLSKALLAGVLALLAAPHAMAACRLSDFTSRGLASLVEVERLAFVTQMTRTEFAKFQALKPGDPNYYPLVAGSANLLQAKQRAQTAIDALGMPQGAEYAKFWASNLLDDKGLKDFTLCVAAQNVGLWMRARESKPGAINMMFAHTRPVGVGPYPVTVVASENIKNTAQLTGFLKKLGPKDQYFAEAFTLLLADRSKPASLTMTFGEETPRTLYLPAFPVPVVAPPAIAASGSNGAANAEAFRDCATICPEMISLPAGSFMMGASRDEDIRAGAPPHQSGKAEPIHKVDIGPGYAIAKYELTIAEFRAFIKATGYQPSNNCTINMKVRDKVWVYEPRIGYNWHNPSYEYTDRDPVTCVTWEDAKAYTDWLSRKTGVSYSLPTEAVYEYAARAGTTTAYFWGNDPQDRNKACLYSNQADLSQDRYFGTGASGAFHRFNCDDGYPVNSPVGSFKPNPWGLYDILGNVWEWTEDCWNSNYQGAPTDGSPWVTGDCDARVMRGGSSGNTPWYARAGNRALFVTDYAGHSLGFRVMSKR